MALQRLFKPGAILQLGALPPIQDLADLPGLRIVFTCDRSLTATPDRLSVQIYGLAPETRAAIAEQYRPGIKVAVTLTAGYGPTPPRLFLGSMVGLQKQVKLGPDLITEVVASEGQEVIHEIPLQIGAAVFTVPQMIDVAIKAIQAGLALSATTPVGALLTSLLVGKHPSVGVALAAASPAKLTTRVTIAHVGRAWDLIEEAARVLGVHAWVRDGLLHFSVPAPTGQVIPIPHTHWLNEPDTDGAVTRLPVLMDPLLVPGVLVQPVDALGEPLSPMRVDHVTYSGDTRGGPWAAALTLREQVYL